MAVVWIPFGLLRFIEPVEFHPDEFHGSLYLATYWTRWIPSIWILWIFLYRIHWTRWIPSRWIAWWISLSSNSLNLLNSVQVNMCIYPAMWIQQYGSIHHYMDYGSRESTSYQLHRFLELFQFHQDESINIFSDMEPVGQHSFQFHRFI